MNASVKKFNSLPIKTPLSTPSELGLHLKPSPGPNFEYTYNPRNIPQTLEMFGLMIKQTGIFNDCSANFGNVSR